jgi:general secretion pathway protein G
LLPSLPHDRRTSNAADQGFTLLELMIVVAILAVLAGMGVPRYRQAVQAAQVARAKQELQTISAAISTYRGNNGGFLPDTLDEVGYGGRLDPWGLPYIYLNFHAGTGSALEFALESGLVDPGAFPEKLAELAKGKVMVSGNGNPDGADVPQGKTWGLRKRAEMEPEVAVKVQQLKRKDGFIFPINSDYDLFSLGPNRVSMSSLLAGESRDDVIRANDGGYFGLAAEY